ncbi:MAG: fumarylacetoacetate hydrolase family protein [Chlorobi bacterium]|nr:fumarylacetoacetate hydrolase family protein [Chlorobiota bacterium]
MNAQFGPTIEFANGRHVPLGTIYCIGRNYADHAREMNAAPPQEPIVFLKPPTAYISNGAAIRPPEAGHVLHHEVEVVVLIGEHLYRANLDEARAAIAAYAVGIDVTLRDLQSRAKHHGLPWAIAKGFATSAPISPFVPADSIASIDEVEFGLSVNSVIRQRGCPRSMIWSIPELLEYLSRWFVLQPGDVLFTGTPSGVGQLSENDVVHAWLGDYAQLDVVVAPA